MKVPFHFSVIKGEEDECSFAEGDWCHFGENGTSNGNWQIKAGKDIDDPEQNNLPPTSFDGNKNSKLHKWYPYKIAQKIAMKSILYSPGNL